MKILHVCLSCFYIDEHSYQENILVRKHIDQGHNVKVLASIENFNEDKKISYSPPGTYMGTDGAEVTRLAYANWLPFPIMKKLRIHNGVYDLINEFKPDVIIFHGMCGWELLTVTKYAMENPHVILKVDSHEDLVNSGRNFVSKNFLHRLYYKPIAKYASKNLDEILCVSISVIEFLRDFYELPQSKLKFYPLGGDIPSSNEYNSIRSEVRGFHSVSEKEILFVQTGKLTTRKKLEKTLKAFIQVKNESFKLIIAGVIDLPNQQEIMGLIESDERIRYIGWQTSKQIDDILCAADVYLQPGTQSATMQNSLCKRCAVVLDDVSSHVPYIKGNGWRLNEHNTLNDVFNEIDKDPNKILEYSYASYLIAQEILDYDKLSKQLLIRE